MTGAVEPGAQLGFDWRVCKDHLGSDMGPVISLEIPFYFKYDNITIRDC